jgi:hypothetical protein
VVALTREVPLESTASVECGFNRLFVITCQFALNAESMTIHAALNIAEISSESGAPDSDMHS